MSSSQRPNLEIRWFGVISRLAVCTALAACGGGGDGPSSPPTPVVSTVEVTPGAPTVTVGETAQLNAVPKTAAGAAVPGKTVTWSSSATTVASVSQTGLVTAGSPGVATVTAMVDGRSGSAQVTVVSRVALDASKVVSKPMGPAGDSLTTTASNGITYTLVVPEGALRSDLTITMTPLVSLAGLPFGGGLLAGVELKPSETEFDRPLTLRIASAGSVPAGKTLIGFTAPDTGGTVTLVPASLTNGIMSIVVPHFSVVGAAPVLPSELAAIAPPVDVQSRVNDVATVAHILAQGGDVLTTLNQLEAVFSSWYARILPVINAGLSGDAELLAALQEYRFWVEMMAFAGAQLGTNSLVELPALASLDTQGREKLYFNLVAAIARANQACLTFRDINKAETVLFWQATAASLGLAGMVTSSTGIAELSLSVVEANLCVQVFVSDSTFPATPAPNQSSNLRLRFGLKFGSDPQLRNATFEVRLTLSGTTADGPADVTTDANGILDFSVVPTGQQPLRITVGVCMVRAVATSGRICLVNPFTIDRVFGITVTGDITVFTAQGLASLSNVSKIIGNLTIVAGSGIANLDPLLMLQEVTGSVGISSLPDLVSLAGLRNLRTVQSLDLLSLPKLASVDGLDNLDRVPGTLGLRSLPLVPNLQGLARIQNIGTLVVGGLPLVTSWTGVDQATIQGLSITQLNNTMTSLAGLRLAPQLNTLELSSNPALSDISAASGVTRVTGHMTIVGNALPSLAALAGLQIVDGVLTLGPGSSASLYTLPLLSAAGFVRLAGGTQACGGGTLTVTLPALAQTGGVNTTVGGASPCPMHVDLSNTTVNGTVDIRGGGIRSISIGPVNTGPAIPNASRSVKVIAGADLVSVSFGSLQVADDLDIQNNPLLTTVSSIQGQVRNLIVKNNPLLSTQAINSWPVTVVGTRSVSGNAQP